MRGLKSEFISKPLWNMTKTYRKIEYEDNQLRLFSDYNEYDFSDLSTGAQEQIFLALRSVSLQNYYETTNCFLS